MKRILLIGIIIAAAFSLSGCLVISCEEHPCRSRPDAICGGPGEVPEDVRVMGS
jgi:hypothetical protein